MRFVDKDLLRGYLNVIHVFYLFRFSTHWYTTRRLIPVSNATIDCLHCKLTHSTVVSLYAQLYSNRCSNIQSYKYSFWLRRTACYQNPGRLSGPNQIVCNSGGDETIGFQTEDAVNWFTSNCGFVEFVYLVPVVYLFIQNRAFSLFFLKVLFWPWNWKRYSTIQLENLYENKLAVRSKLFYETTVAAGRAKPVTHSSFPMEGQVMTVSFGNCNLDETKPGFYHSWYLLLGFWIARLVTLLYFFIYQWMVGLLQQIRFTRKSRVIK